MNHPTDSQINEYLDQALDESTRLVVEAHLQTCTECRARLAGYRFVFDKLSELPDIHLAGDLSAGVMARLTQKPSYFRTRGFAAQLGAALGLLAWLSVQILNPDKVRSVGHLIVDLRFALPAFDLTGLLPDPAALIPLFRISAPALPALHLSLPALSPRIPAIEIGLLAGSVMALWIIGNKLLLNHPSRVQS